MQRPQADGAVCAVGNKEHKQILIAHAIHRDTCTSLTSFMPYNVAHAEREGGREGEREIAGDQREFDFITLSQARTHQTVSISQVHTHQTVSQVVCSHITLVCVCFTSCVLTHYSLLTHTLQVQHISVELIRQANLVKPSSGQNGHQQY